MLSSLRRYFTYFFGSAVLLAYCIGMYRSCMLLIRLAAIEGVVFGPKVAPNSTQLDRVRRKQSNATPKNN